MYQVIKNDKEISLKAWRDFIDNHPLGNVFQLPELFCAYKKIPTFEPIVIIVKKEDTIVGCLTAIIQKQYKGVLGIITSRAIIQGAPLAYNNDLEIIDILLKEYLQLVQQKKVIYSQFRNIFDIGFANNVFIRNGFKYENHLDILIDISIPIDNIKKKISKSKRGNVSKSLNKKAVFFEITNKEDYSYCIRLINKTYQRIGIPCPQNDYFITLFNELSSYNILKIFALKYDNIIIGTRLELCYKDVVYDWWAGADNNYKAFYPNDVIPFNILIWGHNNGYKTFDFGGAGKPNIPYGVREHKKKFGGEIVEFGRYEIIHNKFLMFIGKLGFFIYKSIKKMR